MPIQSVAVALVTLLQLTVTVPPLATTFVLVVRLGPATVGVMVGVAVTVGVNVASGVRLGVWVMVGVRVGPLVRLGVGVGPAVTAADVAHRPVLWAFATRRNSNQAL